MSSSISDSIAGVIRLKSRGDLPPPLIPQAERKNTIPTTQMILINPGIRFQTE
jgi:hypothetical protein